MGNSAVKLARDAQTQMTQVGQICQPTPYEYLYTRIPAGSMEPFWTNVRRRCQQIGLPDIGSAGPCSESDWIEVQKLCGTHKNSYPPGSGSWDPDYMRQTCKLWEDHLKAYKKKYMKVPKQKGQLGDILPSAPEPPPPYVMIKEDTGVPEKKLALYPNLETDLIPGIDMNTMITLIHQSATPEQRDKWKLEIDIKNEEEGTKEEMETEGEYEVEETDAQYEQRKEREREEIFNQAMKEREEANRKREEDIVRREWEIENRKKELRQEKEALEARITDIKKQKEKVEAELKKSLPVVQEDEEGEALTPEEEKVVSQVLASPQMLTRIQRRQRLGTTGTEDIPSHPPPTEIQDTQEGPSLSTPSLSCPTISIGETTIHVPLPLGQIQKIKDLCPVPKRYPREACGFLQKYCTGASLDGEDLKGLVDILDPDPASDLNIKDLYKTHIATGGGNWEAFWAAVCKHWCSTYKGQNALQELVMAKQESKEKFFDFCIRVHKLFKNTDGAGDTVFMTTIMTGGDPKITQFLKLVTPNWMSLKAEEFMKENRLRDIAGVFTQKGGTFYQDELGADIMTPQIIPPDQACFNCGQYGHWKSQCPMRRGLQKRQESRQRGRGQGYPHGPQQSKNQSYQPRYPESPPVPNPHQRSYRPMRTPNTSSFPTPRPHIPMSWPANNQNPQNYQ